MCFLVMSFFIHSRKKWGQHFLRDELVARRIVSLLSASPSYDALVEIGPGYGALTKWLVKDSQLPLYFVEIDAFLVDYLKKTYNAIGERLISGDFLALSLERLCTGRVGLIGNLPYNIASQVLFKVFADRQRVVEVVCMVQKEVAERITAVPGSRIYGLLSVLLQAFYEITYCFDVGSESFCPPPKVTSAVIKLLRNEVVCLDCDEKLFLRVIKAGFGQRRKMLRNALSGLGLSFAQVPACLLEKRAEVLGVEDFVRITRCLALE